MALDWETLTIEEWSTLTVEEWGAMMADANDLPVAFFVEAQHTYTPGTEQAKAYIPGIETGKII